MKKERNWKVHYKATDELIAQAVELDAMVYEGDDIGQVDRCKQWLEVNNQLYTFLTLNDALVGYINFMPITDECYAKIKTGKHKDFQLQLDEITQFVSGKEHKCLFVSVVVRKEFRDGLAIQRLWNGFKSKLEELKSKNVIITDIVTDCVTDIGEKCAINYLNGKFVCSSGNGKIYQGYINI